MKDVENEKKGSWKSFFYLIRHGKIAWGFVVIGYIVSLAAGSIALQFSNKMGELVAGDFSMETLYSFIWMTAIYAVFNGASNIVMVFAQTKSVKNLRTELWNKLMRLPASHPMAGKASEMLSTITVDATSSMTYILMCLVGIPAALYFVYLAAFQAANMSTRFLIPIFCLVPVYIVYAIFMGNFNRRTNLRIQTSIGMLTGFLSERLRNLDIIKAYNNQLIEEASGTEAAHKLFIQNCKLTAINTGITVYVLLFDTVCTVMAVLFGSSMIKAGTLRPQEWATFFVLLPMVNNMLRSASGMWVNVMGALGFTARISEVLMAPEEEAEGDPVDHLGDIEVKNISFSYGEKQVLQNVSFTIPYGKKTAIVGLTGSGKSTLLNLLERFYEPGDGIITLAGKDIAELDLREYRSKIAYVQQDAGMFSGSVREALLYGVPGGKTEDEIWAALETVMLKEDVSLLPGGLDGKIALWGESLSGGQRQKLIIAREMLKGSSILLLDEPTSSLDLGAQKTVFEAIMRGFADRTVVTVTHDLRLIGNADQIIVIDGGSVADIGTHAELMERCPFYHGLVQKKAFEEVYEA